MEDRALRGRTSSADAALQTAGVVAYGRPGPKGRNLPEQVQSEKSLGVRGTESPDSFDDTLKKTENYVSVFSGEVHVVSFRGPAQDFLRFVSFDQPDDRTAKTAAGEAGSKNAWDRGGDFYQSIQKSRAILKIAFRTFVRLRHELAEFLDLTTLQRRHAGPHVLILGGNVQRSGPNQRIQR